MCRVQISNQVIQIYRSTVLCRKAAARNNEKLRATDELGDKKENIFLSDKARFTLSST